MRRLLRVAGVLLVVLLAYLALWPVPADPVAWRAPAFTGYAGPHAANQRLSAAQVVSVAPGIGPEHIDVGPDGKLYTAVLSGDVLRMNPDGSAQQVVVNTGGRPLGFDFTADGRLVVADAIRGLLEIGSDGTITVLADQFDGDPIRYADAVVIAGDGVMYFTDATRRFSPRELGTFDASVLDILEHSCTGRVLAYEPAQSPDHAGDRRHVLPERRRAVGRRPAPVHCRDRQLPNLESGCRGARPRRRSIGAGGRCAGQGDRRQPAGIPGQPDPQC